MQYLAQMANQIGANLDDGIEGFGQAAYHNN